MTAHRRRVHAPGPAGRDRSRPHQPRHRLHRPAAGARRRPNRARSDRPAAAGTGDRGGDRRRRRHGGGGCGSPRRRSAVTVRPRGVATPPADDGGCARNGVGRPALPAARRGVGRAGARGVRRAAGRHVRAARVAPGVRDAPLLRLPPRRPGDHLLAQRGDGDHQPRRGAGPAPVARDATRPGHRPPGRCRRAVGHHHELRHGAPTGSPHGRPPLRASPSQTMWWACG